MEGELAPFVTRFLKSVDVTASSELQEKMAVNVDALIFNVVSLVCTITLINGTHEVSRDFVKLAREYISETCEPRKKKTDASKSKGVKNVKGGGAIGLPLDQPNAGFGTDGTVVDISQIDFHAGDARGGLEFGLTAPLMSGTSGMTMSGGALKAAIPLVPHKFVEKVLAYFKVDAKKTAMKAIIGLLNEMLTCYKVSIQNGVKTDRALSDKAYDSLMRHKRFAAFH
jgi:hypothetical protein